MKLFVHIERKDRTDSKGSGGRNLKTIGPGGEVERKIKFLSVREQANAGMKEDDWLWPLLKRRRRQR